MAADYDFRRKPNEKGDGEVQPLYPRIVSKGTIDSKRLFREIAEASSFTEGDLAGIMVAFQEKVSYYLSEGYHVKLGEIGYFSSSLRARPVMDKKEIRSVSISFDNVNFRATPWFRRRSSGTIGDGDPCQIRISRIIELAGRDTPFPTGSLFSKESLHHSKRILSDYGFIEGKSTTGIESSGRKRSS